MRKLIEKESSRRRNHEYLKQKLSEIHKGKLVGEKNPMYGKHHSEERKQYYREIFSGEGNPRYGVKASLETCAKISKALKGKMIGDKNPFYGRKHSEETKQKLRERFSGANSEHAKKIMCVETGKVYDAIVLAAQEFGMDASGLAKTCKGKQKTWGGYHWKYVDEVMS